MWLNVKRILEKRGRKVGVARHTTAKKLQHFADGEGKIGVTPSAAASGA